MKECTTTENWPTCTDDELVSCGPIRARHELVLLVFLHDHPWFWTAEEASDHLKLSESSTAEALNKLWLYEFLARSGSETRRTFKFAPAHGDLERAAEELADLWHTSTRAGGRLRHNELIVRFDDVLN